MIDEPPLEIYDAQTQDEASAPAVASFEQLAQPLGVEWDGDPYPLAQQGDQEPTPVYNLSAEAALLECLLFGPEEKARIATMAACMEANLSVESFFVTPHQILWHVIYQAFERREALDLIVLNHRLATTPVRDVDWLRARTRQQDLLATPLLEVMGGSANVTLLLDREACSALSPLYLETVLRCWKARKVERHLASFNPFQPNLNQSIARLSEELRAATLDSRQKLKPLDELLDRAVEELEAKRAGDTEQIVGACRTGIDAVDEIFPGIGRKRMAIIAGRPGQGKSVLAVQIAMVKAFEGGQVLLFNLEMPGEELASRMLCAVGSINYELYAKGRGFNTPEEVRQAAQKTARLKDRIAVNDRAEITITEIWAHAFQHKNLHGLDLVCIDYLQLIKANNPRDPREQQVAQITRACKVMAKELDVAVVLLSQLNRKVEEDRCHPKLSFLRESGAAEQDSDVVIFVGPDDPKTGYNDDADKRNSRIAIAKNRNGSRGATSVDFQTQFSRFA